MSEEGYLKKQTNKQVVKIGVWIIGSNRAGLQPELQNNLAQVSMATLGGRSGRLTRGREDHLHTQRSQLSTGTTICYALDSHYFRAKLAGKSISWCQLYQTSMQSASVERKGKGEPLYRGNKSRSNRSSHTKILSWFSTSTRIYKYINLQYFYLLLYFVLFVWPLLKQEESHWD